ncbi:hypothetical protein ACQP0C_22520 [Nocardia sp. CA-129566]|uniref:hypothetical protein n=1 Tax=Nocardia sp. CA-129566 TaxID=3239976 RepID=UPI003D999578
MSGEQPVLVVESGQPDDDELVALVLALTALSRPTRPGVPVRAAVWTLPTPAQEPATSWRRQRR